jgi:uncharacterized protein involved in exopolysaccharide biosynthesis
MIENRDYTIDDYLLILRRRMKWILIPALIAPVVGFLISYAFAPKYTSQALIVVQGQKVPEGVVQPAITQDLAQRIGTIQSQVLSRPQLQQVIDNLGLARNGKNPAEIMDDIRAGMSLQPFITDLSQIPAPGGAAVKHKPGSGTVVPAFYVSYTGSNARETRDICFQLANMMIDENLKLRTAVAQNTTEFISRQLDEAKRSLDEQDAKLAAFKRQYSGQLPGDEENNLKLLGAMNSQLDANTQTVNRAQQDKAYTESLLAQQLSAWRNSQGTTNPQALQQQLATLQSQLLQLQARYTDDHPDVIKTKADIAEVKKEIAAMDASSGSTTNASDKANANEPPEIRQLRLQIHQYGQVLDQATREQKRLQAQIQTYQGRLAVSPEVEEKYKQLTRDYDTAQKFYADLLAKKNTSEMQTQMESQQQGEQMQLTLQPSVPESPSFPNRPLFALGGLGAGLGLGLGVALWLEFRDKSIRDERDVEASLQMPVLVAVPWVTEETSENGNGGGLLSRLKPSGNGNGTREKIGV